MTMILQDFWTVLRESRLVSETDLGRMQIRFDYEAEQASSAVEPTAELVAKWLVESKRLTPYQGRVLLSGHSGPFFVGSYLIVDQWRDGPFAKTYRAKHRPSGHPVLLRLLENNSSPSPEIYEWRCPHLISFHESFQWHSHHVFISESPPGMSVRAYLKSGKTLNIEQTCRLAIEAARGLAHLHDRRHVHGDIRPDYLWLESSGNLKLIFDPQYADRDGASNPSLKARADYQAPEITLRNQTPDALSDIYSLGCSLFELLTGAVPFPGGTTSEKAQRHAKQPIVWPNQTPPISEPLTSAVAHMMAKKRDIRFQSATIVAEKLAPFTTLAKASRSKDSQLATLASYEEYLKQTQDNVTKQRTSDDVAEERENPISIQIESSTVVENIDSPSVHRRWPTSFAAAVLLATVSLVIVLLVTVVWLSGVLSPSDPPTGNTVVELGSKNRSVGKSPQDKQSAANSPAETPFVIVADDGKMLWAVPERDVPLELAYVPSGSPLIIVIRAQALLATSEGQKTLQSLQPVFGSMIGQFEQTTGLKLEQIEQLIIAFGRDEQGVLKQPTIIIRPEGAADLSSLRPSATGASGSEFRLGSWHAFTAEQEGRPIIVLRPEALNALDKSAHPKPLLARSLEKLQAVSNSAQHVTILCEPSFLLGDVATLFAGDASKLIEPLRRWFPRNVAGVMLSFLIDETMYIEIRLERYADHSAQSLVGQLRGHVNDLPEQVEDYLVAVEPAAYWRKLAFRFPQMVSYLAQQTRYGIEENQAVANCVLPGEAASNLAAAIELSLHSSAGTGSASPAAEPTGPKDLREALLANVSLSFPQQSLEFAIRDLTQQFRETYPSLSFPLEIRIIGPELQLEGITRNQQIRDFNVQNQPLGELLKQLTVRANPTVAPSPAHVEQKLVWVIAPPRQGAKESVILVTTRVAAEKAGLTLPSFFALPDSGR